jgi:hypothetical protein
MGLKQLSRGTLDATLRKDSCLWGFRFDSCKQKMLKCKYANAYKIPVTSWGHGGLRWAADGCRDTIKSAGGPRGSLEDRGGCWFPQGASEGPGIAAGVLVSKTCVLVQISFKAWF